MESSTQGETWLSNIKAARAGRWGSIRCGSSLSDSPPLLDLPSSPHHQVGPGFPQSASLLQAPSSQSTTAVDHWFSILISLHADIQFDQRHLLKRLSFFQTVFLAS